MSKYQRFQWQTMTAGVCYYPEHWSKELWRSDLERIKAAGLSVIRIGEFCWSIFEYVGQNIGFRVVIPAGAKFSHFADEHGAVCVVCLAEYYGYERIGADDVLRKPLE